MSFNLGLVRSSGASIDEDTQHSCSFRVPSFTEQTLDGGREITVVDMTGQQRIKLAFIEPIIEYIASLPNHYLCPVCRGSLRERALVQFTDTDSIFPFPMPQEHISGKQHILLVQPLLEQGHLKHAEELLNHLVSDFR